MWDDTKLQDKVRDICKKYVALVCDSALFSPEHRSMVKNGIENNVQSLLYAEKPKVMVYGIYNSGKSTLVNAICKKAVAEVADRPMTSQIAEYDEGRYILIDSPGINVPIEHEEIADRHLADCHIILFVISSKGIFEDRINYQKMWDLIKKELPFYIVLNERSTVLPPKEKGEKLREQALRKHKEELNGIKRKIIKNLINISGEKDIGEKYDVIVLNAKRAWDGIVKENEGLYQKSDISILINRIDAILQGRGALKQLLSPLSSIEGLVNESEVFLLAQSAGQDFADKRRVFEQKVNIFTESFLIDIKTIIENRFEYLYNSYLGRCEKDENLLWEEAQKDIEDSYKNSIYPLNQYMRKAFAGLGLEIDDRCNVSYMKEWVGNGKNEKKAGQVPGERRMGTESAGYRQGSGSLNAQISHLTGGSPGQGSGIVDALLNLFKSKRKTEQEEHERLVREVEAFNADMAQRVEEDIRRHQDARACAHARIDEMSRQARMELSADIREKFDRALLCIDNAIQDQERRSKEIDDMLAECRNLKSDIYELRRGIG